MAKYAIVQSSDLLKRGWSAREHVYPRPWAIVDGTSGVKIQSVPTSTRYDDAVALTKQAVRDFRRDMTLVDCEGTVMEAFAVEIRVKQL